MKVRVLKVLVNSTVSWIFPSQERLIVGSCSCASGDSGMLANSHPSLDLPEEHAPAGLCWEEGGEVEEYLEEQVEDGIKQEKSRRRVINNHFWQETTNRDKLSKIRTWCVLPSSASTQLNSPSTQTKAEVSLNSSFSSHQPSPPATHPATRKSRLSQTF